MRSRSRDKQQTGSTVLQSHVDSQSFLKGHGVRKRGSFFGQGKGDSWPLQPLWLFSRASGWQGRWT